MNSISNQPSQTEICNFIREVGQKAVYLRKSGFQVDEKGFDDYVTNVDRELDILISQQFQSWFPEDIVISEENSRSRSLWEQQRDDALHKRFWFIDPIDGTDDFIHGREFYSVMAGLLEDSQPKMGWVYAPHCDRLYFGGQQLGSKNMVFTSDKGQEPIALNIREPMGKECDRLIVSKKDDLAYGDAIRNAVPNVEFYSLGSFGLKVMEIVQGHASAYIYLNRRVKLWDTVGPLAIAKAAGLICCDLHGREISFQYDDVIADSLIHKQVIIVGWAKFLDQYLEAIAQQFQDIGNF